MDTTRASSGRVWAVVVGMTTVGVLAGCSGEDLAERAIEQGIQNESGEDVDIDLDGGNIRIETEDGVVEMNTDDEGNVSIEGPEGEMSIDAEDGVTVIESDDGTATIQQGAGVPDDFPSSIPLPEGFDPQFSQSMSSADVSGWILGGEVDGTALEIGEAYFPRLEAAGFERLALTETPDSLIFTFDDGEYAVNGLIGADSDATYVNLTISDSQQ